MPRDGEGLPIQFHGHNRVPHWRNEEDGGCNLSTFDNKHTKGKGPSIRSKLGLEVEGLEGREGEGK